MIDREKLQYVKNVLSLTNEDVDITELYNLVTAINRNDELYFLTTMFKLLQPETDASLLKTVFELIKEDPSLEKTLLDSFSHNQIAAKTIYKKSETYKIRCTYIIKNYISRSIWKNSTNQHTCSFIFILHRHRRPGCRIGC